MSPPVLVDRGDLLTTLILMTFLVVLAAGLGVAVVSDPAFFNAFHLIKSAQLINEYHLEEVSARQLVWSARRGMFDLLDRYSGYLEADEFRQMREELTGSYGGIGVTVTHHQTGLVILSVTEGGPADQAGLATGDIIVAADATELAELTLHESSLLLRGEEGTEVTLQVYQPLIGDTVSVTLVRALLPLIHVPYAGYTADRILYVRLQDFESGATQQLRAALDSLALPDTCDPRGLILDLRGNPGGLFREAWRTASLFLAEGAFVVGTDARSRWKEDKLYATGPDHLQGLPMVILVDGGSASSSEIVAGALQQAGRARLVGDTTYGKGLVQGFVGFPDGSGLRLTVSRFYFDNLLYLNEFDSLLVDTGTGLLPDLQLTLPYTDDVVRALENSLLLHRFAALNRDTLSLLTPDQVQDRGWVGRFLSFVAAEDFNYTSPRTEELAALAVRCDNANCDEATKAMIRRLQALAQQEDHRWLARKADYISLRLGQIARERVHGISRAYQEIVVPYRPDIVAAARLLQEGS